MAENENNKAELQLSKSDENQMQKDIKSLRESVHEIKEAINKCEEEKKEEEAKKIEADEQDEIKTKEMYALLKEISILTYENERARDNTMRTQASSLQGAFSFLFAAIAVLMPIITKIFGEDYSLYLAIMFSSIFITLGISLFFATCSQKLKEQTTFLTITDLRSDIANKVTSNKDNNATTDYFVSVLEEHQKSKRTNVDHRAKNIQRSIISFQIALGLCAFWFIASIIILTTIK